MVLTEYQVKRGEVRVWILYKIDFFKESIKFIKELVNVSPAYK